MKGISITRKMQLRHGNMYIYIQINKRKSISCYYIYIFFIPFLHRAIRSKQNSTGVKRVADTEPEELRDSAESTEAAEDASMSELRLIDVFEVKPTDENKQILQIAEQDWQSDDKAMLERTASGVLDMRYEWNFHNPQDVAKAWQHVFLYIYIYR